MKIGNIASSAVVIGALLTATIFGIKYSRSNDGDLGWNQSLVSQMEKNLQVSHKLVKEAEMYSNRGYGSLAPVFESTKDGVTRINFDFINGDGQAIAFYQGGEMIKAVYFNEKGKRLTIGRNREGRLEYDSRDMSPVDKIE